MITLRQRILIVLGVALFVIVAIILSIVLTRKSVNEPGDVVEDEGSPQVQDVDGNIQVIKQPVEIPQLDPEEVYVGQLARMFVERFSTYSNQNENVHIEDVLDLATPEMKTWIDLQSLEQSGGYEGVTTQVFSTDIVELTDVFALIDIGAKQMKIFQNGEGMEEVVEINQGKVELVKVGEDWKVDGFWWNN